MGAGSGRLWRTRTGSRVKWFVICVDTYRCFIEAAGQAARRGHAAAGPGGFLQGVEGADAPGHGRSRGRHPLPAS